MVRRFCANGHREGVKGSVHGAACALALLMASYNTAAWCYRRERHLGANAIIYLFATAFEVKQTLRHLAKPRPSFPEAAARPHTPPPPERLVA